MADKLTKKTLDLLAALWDAKSMTLRHSEAQKASGATHRGFHLVMNRALNANYVIYGSVEYRTVALTFKGMIALREHYSRLYADRPCEAYRLQAEKYARIPYERDVA